MRRHALLSRSRRQFALANNLRASHFPLHTHIAGHQRLSSILTPVGTGVSRPIHVTATNEDEITHTSVETDVSRPITITAINENEALETGNRETARVSPTFSPPQHVGKTLAVSLPTDETTPSVGTDVSRPMTIPTPVEDERMQLGTDVSHPANPSIADENETIGAENRETAQRVGETLAPSQLHRVNVPISNENEHLPVGTDSSRPVDVSTAAEDDTTPFVGSDVSRPADIAVADQDAMNRSLQTIADQQPSHERQQEHHGQAEQLSTSKTRPQPKRGRIVERSTTTEETRPAPLASQVKPSTALSKNANMYRTSDNNTPQTQSTEADDLFAPRATENRSPQAWAARLFKTSRPEQAQNEPSPSVPPVTDAMMRLNEVGADVSLPGLGSLADREAKTPADRELNPPTDAHEGLPYYTTDVRAKHVQYSRVAPRGRPLGVPGRSPEAPGRPLGVPGRSPEAPGRPLGVPGRSPEAPGRTRFVAPLSQPAQPIQLSQHARTLLRPLVGIDPTEVSIYQDTIAAQVTDTLNADAVTLSADTIALAPETLPDTPATLGLLAHELTHIARRQIPRFVPPVVKPALSTANAMPVAATENNAPSTDEEGIAERVEQTVIEVAQGQHNPIQVTQEPYTDDSTKTLKNAHASSGENILWGDLPAPWEPLPDWLVVPSEDTPIATPDAGAQWLTQTPLYQSSEAGYFGNSDFVHTSQSLNNDTMVEDIQRAGRERTLEQEDVSASSAQPSLQEPQPDLDALARQVYNVLKRRLEAEYRRSQ